MGEYSRLNERLRKEQKEYDLLKAKPKKFFMNQKEWRICTRELVKLKAHCLKWQKQMNRTTLTKRLIMCWRNNMKELTEDLKFKLMQSHAGLKKVSWNDVYDTEEELVRDLFNNKIYTDEDKVPMHMWCKGYEFVKGFRKYYEKNDTLTEKQMTQLKRMASEIAFRVYCEGKEKEPDMER